MKWLSILFRIQDAHRRARTLKPSNAVAAIYKWLPEIAVDEELYVAEVMRMNDRSILVIVSRDPE